MHKPDSSEKVTPTGYRAELLPAYLQFAAHAFGSKSYQAARALPYLQWLYEENPTPSNAERDFILCVDTRGRVVGCAHKLRMMWRVEGREIEVPALHNLMVAQEHRSGLGAVLMLSALGRDAHVLICGVGPYLSPAYRRLGSQPVDGRRFRWILNPAGAAVRLAAGRLGWHPRPWSLGRWSQLQHLFPDLRLEMTPPASRYAELATIFSTGAGLAAGPAWTVDRVAWRFFHPLGPRHVLATDRGERFIGIVSLGSQRGLRLARLVELHVTGRSDLRPALRSLRRALFVLGGDVLFGFSADPEGTAVLSRVSTPLVDGVDTYVYHRRRTDTFRTVGFYGGASDFGFEAI